MIKQISIVALFAALAICTIPSCAGPQLQHCECTVTIVPPNGDTTFTDLSASFSDTQENADDYCSIDYQNGLMLSYPDATVTCVAVND